MTPQQAGAHEHWEPWEYLVSQQWIMANISGED